jgi:hypothetical protein
MAETRRKFDQDFKEGAVRRICATCLLGLDRWSLETTKIIPRIFRIMVARCRTLQGMARVRSGQAAAWPLSSGRSVRRGSGVKRDFACTFTRHFSPVLVALRSQSRLRLEGRTRMLSGSSPDLSPARTFAPSALSRQPATGPPGPDTTKHHGPRLRCHLPSCWMHRKSALAYRCPPQSPTRRCHAVHRR